MENRLAATLGGLPLLSLAGRITEDAGLETWLATVILIAQATHAPSWKHRHELRLDGDGICLLVDPAHLDTVDIVERVYRGIVRQPLETGIIQGGLNIVPQFEQLRTESEGIHNRFTAKLNGPPNRASGIAGSISD